MCSNLADQVVLYLNHQQCTLNMFNEVISQYKKLHRTLHLNFLCHFKCNVKEVYFVIVKKTKCKGNHLLPHRCIILKRKNASMLKPDFP